MRGPATLFLLALAGLAGCVDGGDGAAAAVETAIRLEPTAGCGLAFPDGTPWPCDESILLDGGGSRPTIADTWSCVGSYTDGRGGRYERYRNPEGQYAAYFETMPFKQAGVTVNRFLMVTADEGHPAGVAGHAAVAYHSDGAFLPVEEPLGDTPHDAYVTLRQFYLYFLEAGLDDRYENWRVAGDDEASLIVGAWNGLDWYAWEFRWRGDTYYVPMSGPAPDEDELLQWAPLVRDFVLPDGTQIITDTRGDGIKFLAQGGTDPAGRVNAALRMTCPA